LLKEGLNPLSSACVASDLLTIVFSIVQDMQGFWDGQMTRSRQFNGIYVTVNLCGKASNQEQALD